MKQTLEEKTNDEKSNDERSKFGFGTVVNAILIPGYSYKLLLDEGKKSGRNLLSFSTVVEILPLEIMKAGVYTYCFFQMVSYFSK